MHVCVCAYLTCVQTECEGQMALNAQHILSGSSGCPGYDLNMEELDQKAL